MGKTRRTPKVGVSKHSVHRSKQRAGHKSVKKLFKRALDEGLKTRDFRGQFRRYLESKELAFSRAVVYGEYIYIYDFRCYTLITVYLVPREFLTVVRRRFKK